ncbi:pitrilysin family protein [uncultured Psychroserpens sp.]|uniref:M16 family metallopeptidase n=1 Tax=uncultured Psychroserpens sp. TaxID=255436 RepID=UPI00262DCC91|nr:pitrilysin family protein [uncultured Psychroserpens sp.]
MKKCLLFLASLMVVGFSANAQKVEFEEFDLDNGLHVILHQDNTAPVVTVGVMYDVGGKDLGGSPEAPRTGFAHFFEHLLFEGTKNIDRGEWFTIVSSNGGSNNANTSLDRTYYYEVFPSNNLELGLWMESERMLHPVIDQVGVDTQNEVVKEEKRLRYDNSPYGQFLFAVSENLFKAHPYKNKNIGEMADLDASTLAEFQDYFKKWYGPNNAALVVAGDIDSAEAKEMIKKYFSDIPSRPVPTRSFAKEAPITQTIKAEYRDPNIQIPAIITAYRTPGFKERDSYVLNMVSAYLSDGKTSKLYKKLVDDKKMALQAGAINVAQMDYSIYAVYGLPLGDTSLDDLLAEMDEEIAKMQTELISEKDYQKLQNKFENRFVNSNSGVQGIANSLVRYYMLYDDINLINNEIDIYRSITRQEIQDVVKKYLNPNQRVELEYLPKEKSDN